MKKLFGGLLVALVAVTGLVGCGSASTLGTQPVEGTVTLDGDPVEGATVDFIPAQAGSGAAATGMTDASGRYSLTVLDPPGESIVEFGSGTLPGEYHVTVRKATVAPTPESASRQSLGKKTYIVPQKYENPKTSGLKATVADGKNDVNLELQKR